MKSHPERLEMRDGGGIERRRHPRGYFSFKVSAGNLEDMSSLPLTALNLSASGLYCISPKSLGELARLDLVLHLEDVGEIPARAVVIREERLPGDQFGLGLFFTSVSDGDRARISRVVAGALERESKGGG